MKVTPWIKKRTKYGRFELDNWVRYTDDYISIIASIIFVKNIPSLSECYSCSIYLCHKISLDDCNYDCWNKEFSSLYRAILWSDIVLKDSFVELTDPLIFDL